MATRLNKHYYYYYYYYYYHMGHVFPTSWYTPLQDQCLQRQEDEHPTDA